MQFYILALCPARITLFCMSRKERVLVCERWMRNSCDNGGSILKACEILCVTSEAVGEPVAEGDPAATVSLS